MLLTDYFFKEIETYKKGQVRQVTYNKYHSNGRFLIENFPDLVLSKMTADDYQQILNKYAETHEKTTTTDRGQTTKTGRACVGKQVGTYSYTYDKPNLWNDRTIRVTVQVPVYDSVTVLPYLRNQRAIDVFIEGKLFNRIFY